MSHTELTELADAQLGLITHSQALALGATERHVRYRVEAGLWDRLHRGVFRVRGAAPSFEQSLLAACLAIGPEAAASHRAAAVQHGLLSYRRPPVEVTTTRLRSPELAGVTVHRLADLHPRWVERVHSVPVTTVARTIVDLGAVAAPRTVEAMFDRAAGRRLVTPKAVRDAMLSVARKGRRGVGTVRPLVDDRLRMGVPAGVFEATMAALLRRHGLPHPEAEHTVTDEDGGFVAVVDFAYPERRLALEVDGYEFHSSPRAVRYGQQRDRLLVDAGWLPLHFTWSEVERNDAAVIDAIRRELRARPVFSAR